MALEGRQDCTTYSWIASQHWWSFLLSDSRGREIFFNLTRTVRGRTSRKAFFRHINPDISVSVSEISVREFYWCLTHLLRKKQKSAMHPLEPPSIWLGNSRLAKLLGQKFLTLCVIIIEINKTTDIIYTPPWYYRGIKLPVRIGENLNNYRYC